jgi:pyruvate ferredoxin oxidoreductase gamma subunit
MKEIRIHGRGGQGSLVLAQFMAIAALEDEKYGQAFPFLGGGGERRGKAIMAYCRLNDTPIRIRCKVSEPDYVIVQDPTILYEMDVFEGIKPDSKIIINTEKGLSELGLDKYKTQVVATSAEDIARKILGRPIINTALLGTFAGLTRELSLSATLNAVRRKFPGELGRKNARLVEECYKNIEKVRK